MLSSHCFIWYRIRGDAVAARASVNALMQEVTLRTGVIGRLLMRHDDPSTWMEVYESIADAALFDSVLQEATANAGPVDYAIDGRHVERFVDAL